MQDWVHGAIRDFLDAGGDLSRASWRIDNGDTTANAVKLIIEGPPLTEDHCTPVWCPPLEEVRLNWFAKITPAGEHVASVMRNEFDQIVITIEPDVAEGEAMSAAVQLIQEVMRS